MQTWTKVAAAVGILGMAVAVYFLRGDNMPNDLAGATSYGAEVMCRSCGESYPATLTKSDTYPLTCKKCGKREAWPQKQCYECQHRFVPEPVGDPPHMPVVPRCPKCNSDRVGAADSDE
jgi:hypothetical protein